MHFTSLRNLMATRTPWTATGQKRLENVCVCVSLEGGHKCKSHTTFQCFSATLHSESLAPHRQMDAVPFSRNFSHLTPFPKRILKMSLAKRGPFQLWRNGGGGGGGFLACDSQASEHRSNQSAMGLSSHYKNG